MMTTVRFVAVLLLALLALRLKTVAAAERIDFNREVRPILSENCYLCHGADAGQRQADLRLDVREQVVERQVIVPGSSGQSSLVERITASDERIVMPPPDSHRRLTPAQVELLKRWIDEGAEYQPHWAFQPVERPAAPAVELADWPRNEIDRFVLSKLEAHGMHPSPPAPTPALLRRIGFDVIGLPATPAQLAAWQAAADPVAAALDELFASPHYGERLAADWLDVARYADTHGFNNDSARTMWRWRDWVVDALNANMPYDRFIAMQLAGDLLPNASLEDRIATAFNRNHVINSEGGIIDEEYRVEYVADRVRTMSLAWLGLTMECARCHDHKFDPISQQEYYELFTFFNNVDETGEDGRVDNAAPLMRAPTREQAARYQELQRKEASLFVELQESMAKLAASPAWPDNASNDSDAGNRPGRQDSSSPAPEGQATLALQAADTPLRFPMDQPVTAESQPVELASGWAFAAWVKRSSATTAPLLSSMDFSSPPSSQGYGDGLEVRLTPEGAVEVRIAVRWPGYSLSVRSVDTIARQQWRHIAITGSGTKAAGVRIFIDGVEADTDVRHDDLTGGVKVSGAVQIGGSSDPTCKEFAGELSRLQLFGGRVEDRELDRLMQRECLDASPLDADESPSWERTYRAASRRFGQDDSEFASKSKAWKDVRGERLALQRSFPTLMIMRDLPQPRETFVLERGQYNRPGAQVTANVPSALGLPLPSDAPRDRRALARWLTDPRQPLTARVVVNRYWHSLFGVGLVKTVEDFGSQGEYPSHPELLDWLAAEFVESGWNVKHLLRLIVESATYQQTSAAAAELWANDPENRLLARGPRRRLSAEMIRDQALSVSGLLAPRLGGPPAYPYQPADLYQGVVVAAGYPGTSYQESTGEDLYRRSLYTFWKRTVPHPTLATFDAPDREICTARRTATNTPLQALVLMNDPTFLEASRRLAVRMLHEGGAADGDRLAWGFELLTGRRPEPAETAKLVGLLDQQRKEFASNQAPPGLLNAGASEPAAGDNSIELAAYASVASLLLNLDEAVTRN